MDKKEVLNQIRSMKVVCKEGQDEIIKLVEKITGEKLSDYEEIKGFSVGDVFSGATSRVAVLSTFGKYFITGLGGDFLKAYSDMQNADFGEILAYLNKYKMKKIGKLEVKYVPNS